MARGRYLSAGNSVIVASESKKEEPSQDLEDRIESLSKELSGLINEAGTHGREELRDYAVSLIQGETETTLIEEPHQEDESGEQGPGFNPLALSIPFVLMGFILLLLFPPVGLFMLFFAVLMAVGGGLYTMFLKRK